MLHTVTEFAENKDGILKASCNKWLSLSPPRARLVDEIQTGATLAQSLSPLFASLGFGREM